MPGRRVLIHLGAHRTGTTYLQSIFAQNRQVLAQHNIRYLSVHEAPPIRQAFLRARSALRRGNVEIFEKELQLVTAFFSARLQEHPDSDLLITYEGFLGDISLRGSDNLYPLHSALLDGLMVPLKGENVHGAFAVREYGAFVESGYKYLAQIGRRVGFARYVAGLNVENLSWLPIVEALKETFGENLSVWAYEDFATSPRALTHWLLNHAFGKRAELPHIPAEASNASVSRAALPILLMINRLTRTQRKASNGLYTWLLRCFPASRFGRAKLFNEGARRHLGERYSQDLKAIHASVPGFYDGTAREWRIQEGHRVVAHGKVMEMLR